MAERHDLSGQDIQLLELWWWGTGGGVVVVVVVVGAVVRGVRAPKGRLPGNITTHPTLPRPALVPAFPDSTLPGSCFGSPHTPHALGGIRQTDRKVQ